MRSRIVISKELLEHLGNVASVAGAIIAVTLAFSAIAWETRANSLQIAELKGHSDATDKELRDLMIEMRTSLIEIKTVLHIKDGDTNERKGK